MDKKLYPSSTVSDILECKVFEDLGTLYDSSIHIQIDEHRILPTL